MYQSIDETEAELEPARSRASYGWLALCAVLLGGAAVFAVVFSQSPGREAGAGQILSETKSRAAYVQAISEPTAALRRARLQDFLRIHPTDPHVGAVQSQLAQINAAEARDWETVVRSAYAPKLTREEKLDTMAVYAGRWNPNLLGGRSDEFLSLKAEVDDMAPTSDRPDRRLVEGQSVIPKSMKSDALAGGPTPAQAPPPMAVFLPKPTPAPTTQAVIIGPKIRRNVKPRYPRKALRKRVDGVVTLSMNIDANGKVAMTEVMDVKAERYQDDFIKASERAAMRTRFHPKTIDGKPVAAVGILKRYRFEASRRER